MLFSKRINNMDIGLYQLKYPFRKLLEGLLSLCRNVHPNTVSRLVFLIGFLFALACYFAASGHPAVYLLVISLGFTRMVASTLDGLIAERFGKQSARGELINRLAPELSDALYLSALVLARTDCLCLGVLTLAIAWITSFSGLLGLIVHKGVQSVGPVGQTDRLVALLLFSLAAYFSPNIDWIRYFFLWTIAGGSLTIALRLSRVFANLP